MKTSIEKIITGCIILVISLLMFHLASTQIKEASLAGVSPRAVPFLVARCVLFLSLVMIAQGAGRYFLERREGKATLSKVRYQAFPFLLFALIILYTLVMNYAGYIIASFTILPLMMYVLHVRKVKNFLILTGLVIFVFVVIDVLLKIRLPKLGILGII
jgi:hypothetical protein